MENCIFCKIVRGEIHSYKLYEDKDILAFLDIQPLTKGHCLVIPKKHFQDIFNISESDLQRVSVLSKSISEKIKKNLGADGVRISQSNGRVAGQDVMHYHLHVIPRYSDDGLSNNPNLTIHSPKADPEDLKQVLGKIRL